MRSTFMILILSSCLTISCYAQEYMTKQYLGKGDRALYFFDIGPTIQTQQLSNLSRKLKEYNLPQINRSAEGIHLTAQLQQGKRLVLATSFLHYEQNDSINYTTLSQRNFEYNVRIGYNIFKARIIDRFGIVPQLGFFTQRSTMIYERSTDNEYKINIDNNGFILREGKNKIIRNSSGVLGSLLINYGTRTGSMIDLFAFGVEPGCKYSLSPHGTHRLKKNKLYYNAPENRLSPFINIHFKIPFILWSNMNKKNDVSTTDINFVKN